MTDRPSKEKRKRMRRESELRINYQYQSLHLPDKSDVDWVLVQRVERDISLLYHQLAEYSFIMGDLYYGDVYALPYWNFLDTPGLPEDKQAFICNGCLIMILAMAWDEIDGSGDYLTKFAKPCAEALGRLEAVDESSERLLAIVRDAVTAAVEGSCPKDLFSRSVWVHETFVRGYFKQIAKGFDENPYFRREAEE